MQQTDQKGSCIQAAQEALAGADNTGGATCFRRASSGIAGVVIGNHVLLKECARAHFFLISHCNIKLNIVIWIVITY